MIGNTAVLMLSFVHALRSDGNGGYTAMMTQGIYTGLSCKIHTMYIPVWRILQGGADV